MINTRNEEIIEPQVLSAVLRPEQLWSCELNYPPLHVTSSCIKVSISRDPNSKQHQANFSPAVPTSKVDEIVRVYITSLQAFRQRP